MEIIIWPQSFHDINKYGYDFQKDLLKKITKNYKIYPSEVLLIDDIYLIGFDLYHVLVLSKSNKLKEYNNANVNFLLSNTFWINMSNNVKCISWQVLEDILNIDTKKVVSIIDNELVNI